jgi:hypothetical protein
MKKIIFISITALISILSVNNSFAQATTAMDFNRADCNGTMHHLFTNDLDSGNVVILEFFMGGGCAACISAGHTLESMKTGLLAAHPGKIRAYTSGFSNSMSCATISTWVSSNGFTSTPIDSGATPVAYYGGFGMPTIVILAGTTHKVIYTDIGFSSSDTVAMKSKINSFFAGTLAVTNLPASQNSINIFPNPANDKLNINMLVKEQGELNIQIVDLTGKLLLTVANEKVKEGDFTKTVNISSLSNGLYVVKVTINGNTSSSKLTIAK